jgi:hypothetical protein
MKPKPTEALRGLDELERASNQELRKYFRISGIGEIPKNASRSFLAGHLAWAIQARRAGLNPMELRACLIQQLRQAKKISKPVYKPGTRLIREWHGKTHEVTVEECGFSWNNQRYRSLSEIAREITGTRWSGPRFFGLTGNGADNG